MRYAIPVSDGVISQHFGHCEQFALLQDTNPVYCRYGWQNKGRLLLLPAEWAHVLRAFSNKIASKLLSIPLKATLKRQF